MLLSAKQEIVASYASDIENLQPQQLSAISLSGFLEAHRRYPIISITGQAGVGKTVFTEIFTKRLSVMLANKSWAEQPKVKVVTELPQLSPYLPIIKASKDGLLDQGIWVENQDLFLHTDKAVITKAAIESRQNIIVMDFALTQVQIYADLKIKGKEWKRFRKDFNRDFGRLPKPDILIHIAAKSDTVLHRLEKRGSYIDETIMKSVEILNDYYNKKGIIEEYYQGIPMITIYTDDMDLLGNPEDKMLATQQAVDVVLAKVQNLGR